MDTYVEIDLDKLGHNAKEITTKYNDYKYFFAVLKSDAYGHGEYIVNELYKNGINYFAVSYIKEALDIRKYNKDVPVLLLQPINLNDINIAIKNKLTIVVHELKYLKELIKLNIKNELKIHLKIDSGMNRLGFTDKTELKEAVDIINNTNNLILEGIYSHFATIGLFDKHWDNQIERFKDITSLIDLKRIPIVHMGSSVILVSHPKIEFCNGVRMGILLYGFNVCPTTSNKGIKNILRNYRNKYFQKKYNISKTYTNVKLNVEPAFSLYTNILQIKKIKAGEYIGYGATYKTKKDMMIAVLPIGYNSGIGRANIGRYVLINDKKYKVLGEVGMNMLTIEVDESVSISDKVVVLGNSITPRILASFADRTIADMLISMGKSNERRYIKDNKIDYIEK